MRIVQWNTHHGGKRSDNVLDTAGFGAALVTLNADVICLNEVEQHDGYGNDDKVAKWCAALGPTWRGYFANLSGVVDGHGQGNAILVKNAEAVGAPLLLEDVKTLYGSRVAVGVQLNNLMIVAAHLDDFSQSARFVETVQLLGWPVVKDSGPIVLCGDWNAPPTAVDMAPYHALYTDAWDACVKTKTATSFKPNGVTKSTRIDAIFGHNVTFHTCNVPDMSRGGVFPSDHYPVVVEIQ